MPAQCPECARFLARAFVEGLAEAPADCPKCGTTLTAEHFAAPSASSIRPPDLDPTDVRVTDDGQPDPLAGWDDPNAAVVDLESYRERRLAPPPDAAIVAGASLVGALVGLLLGRRRGLAAVLGALFGALAAGAARQVWRLED